MFGGDWCGWCHRLHGLFATNPEVHKTLSDEYVPVMIELESPNATELLKTCKAALSSDELQKGVGYPFLAVLDSEGKVVTAQRTDPLEEGDHHDPKKVQDFLSRWVAATKEANLVVEEVLSRSASEDKRVFLIGYPLEPKEIDQFLAIMQGQSRHLEAKHMEQLRQSLHDSAAKIKESQRSARPASTK